MFGGGKRMMELCKDKWLIDNAIPDDIKADNISNLNPVLNELTPLYLIWKHPDLLPPNTQHIGLCHYRRFFNKQFINKHIDEADGIVVNPIALSIASIPCTLKKQYAICHYEHDFEVLKDIIIETNLFDDEAYSKWCNLQCLFAPCNMFVLNRITFNMYCKDLFNVALKLPYRIKVDGYDDYQKRACSFLCERFTSYWMYTQCLRNRISLIGTNVEAYLDWKPKDSGDGRGSYAGVFKGD